jgi:glyoxylase-like metal-dependent hydrolase (beta-lactamase superfamily II)
MSALHLDDLEIIGLTDLDRFDIPLNGLLPDASEEALHGIDWLSKAAFSDGILHLKIRSWLLKLGGRVILIDSCVGNHKVRPLRPDWHQRDGTAWLTALAATGVAPDDIDIVMCTHLHADHVGWNTRLEDGRWVPTFPKARYICGRQEYRFWEGEHQAGREKHGAFADSVLPVMEAGRMDLVDDGYDLGTGLTLHAAPGHTPGHTCVHAKQGPGAVFSGDAIHSPLQLAYPDWSSAFCTDPDRARRTRLALLEDIADSGRLLIPAHFPDPGWTRIIQSETGFAPQPYSA